MDKTSGEIAGGIVGRTPGGLRGRISRGISLGFSEGFFREIPGIPQGIWGIIDEVANFGY